MKLKECAEKAARQIAGEENLGRIAEANEVKGI